MPKSYHGIKLLQEKLKLFMSFYLFIAASLGLFIFLIGYIIIVIASFKHHTVTGLISLIPGINLAVLPSIWSKSHKAFQASILGIGIALIAWYSGGNQYFLTNLSTKQSSPPSHIVSESSNSQEINPPASTSRKIKETPLPKKPLYYIIYEEVDHSELVKLTNQHIRVTLIDERKLEGKNIKTTDDSLLLEIFQNNESRVVQISPQHIKVLEKLMQTKD